MVAVGRHRKILAYFALALGVIWVVAPLYWLLITALKTFNEVQGPPLTFIPQRLTLDGFSQAWQYGGAQGLRDSALTAAGTLALCLILGVPAAYSLSRYRPGGPNFAFGILGVRFLPPISMATALYIVGARLHLVDTYAILIGANALFNLPFVIWLMKGFIDEVPYAVEEAAQMDGATWWQALRDHVLPLTTPGLVAVSLFVVIFTWNEFILATHLTGAQVVPYTRALLGLNLGQIGLCSSEYCNLIPNWPAVAALGLITLAPTVVLAFYLQKHLVRALSYGALKGPA